MENRNGHPPDARTRAVRSGLGGDNDHRAIVPPLHLSSTFAFESFGEPGAYDYTRSGNPTRDLLADAISDLEGGVGTTVTSSGMAAITLLCQLLGPGDLLVAPHDCYGGTYRLLSSLSDRGQFEIHFVDQTDSEALQSIFRQQPRLILVETPSNPLLRITDISEVAGLCERYGTLLAVDNTFLSPVLQRPIPLGADLVIHSTTKYLNGHSDLVGGAVVAAGAGLHEELQWWSNTLGLAGAPFDSYLTLRGIRSLHARMRLHEENAAGIVGLLSSHPLVEKVYYPGLETHPGHEIAARQQSGFGAIVAFEPVGGAEAAARLAGSLDCFFLAESLGGVESLIAHPATMSHASMEALARRRAGISDALLRLSVGIEESADLIADLEKALEVIGAPDAATAQQHPIRGIASR